MAKEKLSVGIDLGGTNIQCGLVTSKGEVIARDSCKTKADLGADAVVERMIQTTNNVLDKADGKTSDLSAIGVGAPGIIDPDTGIVHHAPNLGWLDYPLSKQLNKKFGCPIIVDNDVNLGAWGEHVAGAGKKYGDMLAVFVGTGVGGGLVLNGKLYHGHFGFAGEIGYNVLNADGGVGRRTLEDRASRSAVGRRLLQMMQTHHDTVLHEILGKNNDRIRSKVIFQAVKRGDPQSIKILEETARDVGLAISSVVNLLSLSCVVVGGGLTEALRDWFVDRVRTAFNEHVFFEKHRQCEILMSQLHDDAGVIGAGLLALDRSSEKPKK